MQVRISRGATLAVAALALAIAPLSAQQQAAKPDQAPSCTLLIEPTPIQAQANAFDVRALLGQELGDELKVTVAQESGLQIAVVPPEVEPAAEQAGEIAQREAEVAKKPAEKPAAEAARPDAPAEFEAKQIVVLKLDATAATPGEYDISVSSEAGQCSGKVTVTAKEPEGN